MKITYQIGSRRNWNPNYLQLFACLADRLKGQVRYVGFQKYRATQRFRVLVDQELVRRKGKRRYCLRAAADRKRCQGCVFEQGEDRQETLQWKPLGRSQYVNDELFEVWKRERFKVLSRAC